MCKDLVTINKREVIDYFKNLLSDERWKNTNYEVEYLQIMHCMLMGEISFCERFGIITMDEKLKLEEMELGK